MSRPILIYDDHCTPCTRFARIVGRLSKGRIIILGHYSNEGMRIKDRIFPKDYNSEIMFWLINEREALGGRYGLLYLIIEIVRGLLSKERYEIKYECEIINCKSDCALPSRIYSLLSNGKRIKYNKKE